MPAISRTTNPTRVKRIEKSKASVRVIKSTVDSAPRFLLIDRLDTAKSDLPIGTRVACIASAGPTAQYFELGTVESPALKPQPLSELAADAAMSVRVIFYEASGARILASIDGIRPLDEGADSTSLVTIQPAPLEGPLWRLELGPDGGDENPLLLVEESLFGNAKAAAANAAFVAMVLPEVLRQVATRVFEYGADESDEGGWIARWQRFLDVVHPPATPIDDDVDGWVTSCVRAFCERGHMAAIIEQAKISIGGTEE